MRVLCGLLVSALAAYAGLAGSEAGAGSGEAVAEPAPGAKLTTVALRVHRVEEMVAFYGEAFGAEFRQVETRGVRSWFGDVGGITFKLVPIRTSADFVDFPSHQPGFEVADVEAVIALAEKYGGRQEGEILRLGATVHGSVRDPDGNTLELYSPGP